MGLLGEFSTVDDEEQTAHRPSSGGYRFGAANLFDEISQWVDGEGNMEMTVAGGEDYIGALPDELLQYIMSFLLSRDAVRTCILAKRWRALWKSVPALRIDDPESYGGATGSSMFVDELLRLRDPTPLNACIISSDCEDMVDDDSDWDEEAFERMAPWIQYAVSCQVQELSVYFPLRVTNMTLISSHLKRLDFYNMRFEGSSLDFSSCQVLEVLTMGLCDIFADILSQSLKYIDIGTGFDWDNRTYIFAPNLTGFRITVDSGLTPLIFGMPSLVTASVILGDGCTDNCRCGNLLCEGCCGEAVDIEYSVVLEALSGAMNLELEIYDPALFIFRKDLKWCPMFSKLKTLLLNEWCLVDGFKGLVYFLQHSPILETLTIDLQFQRQQKELVTETGESYYKPREYLLLSKHLKVVKILCQTGEDVEIPHILKILGAHGVHTEKIVIQSKDEED